MGQVELKTRNRGEIVAEQRSHERGPVIGCRVFERSPVQRGTAIYKASVRHGASGAKVYSMINTAVRPAAPSTPRPAPRAGARAGARGVGQRPPGVGTLRDELSFFLGKDYAFLLSKYTHTFTLTRTHAVRVGYTVHGHPPTPEQAGGYTVLCHPPTIFGHHHPPQGT